MDIICPLRNAFSATTEPEVHTTAILSALRRFFICIKFALLNSNERAYETEPTNNKATRTSPSNADERTHGTFPPWMTRRQCVPHRHRRTVSFRHSLSPRFRLGRDTVSIFFRSINVRRRSRLEDNDNNTHPIHVLRANSATSRRARAPLLHAARMPPISSALCPPIICNVTCHVKCLMSVGTQSYTVSLLLLLLCFFVLPSCCCYCQCCCVPLVDEN